MPVYLVVILLFVSTVLFFSLFYVKSTLGSDQAVHLLFINLIRENKHRFIRHVRTFLIQPNMTYPQLLHWIFSFVPERSQPFLSNILPTATSLLSLSAFLLFVQKLFPHLTIALSFEKFLLLSGLLFITTPFTYNINNAKNAGISARGLGLFLGQVYTYCVVLFILDANVWYLVVAGVAGLLILMSSQFAAQYLLFGSVVMSLLYMSWVPVAPVIASIAAYFMISPRVALQFFTGNYGHKKFYYKYIAETLLIVYRESIWKDVFYEIWRLIATRQKPRGGGTLFMYVYNNPVVILVFSLPLALPLCLRMINESTGLLWILSVPFVTGLVLFFLTSFRKTRFLGEPERYVEFSIGLTSVIALLTFEGNLTIVYIAIAYQFVMVFMQALVSKKRAAVKSTDIMKTLSIIDQSIGSTHAGEGIRLLSNNTEIMRSLITPERSVFYPSLYSEWYGKFHFPELYSNFNQMYDHKIIPVIKEFSINRFVLDSGYLARDRFEVMIKDSGLIFTEAAAHGTLVSFKVSTIHQT